MLWCRAKKGTRGASSAVSRKYIKYELLGASQLGFRGNGATKAQRTHEFDGWHATGRAARESVIAFFSGVYT